jgi:hypothetical protein
LERSHLCVLRCLLFIDSSALVWPVLRVLSVPVPFYCASSCLFVACLGDLCPFATWRAESTTAYRLEQNAGPLCRSQLADYSGNPAISITADGQNRTILSPRIALATFCDNLLPLPSQRLTTICRDASRETRKQKSTNARAPAVICARHAGTGPTK